MKTKLFVLALLCFSFIHAQKKLKIAVVGLTHDHAHNIMNEYRRGEVSLVGIVETNPELIARYQKRYAFPTSIIFASTEALLNNVTPDAIMAYNAISEHIDVARACIPKKIPLMVEKPLAVNLAQAKEMQQLSTTYTTPILTNYETTWYGSNQTLHSLVKEKAFGGIKKMIARDGHEGPKEIGCSSEFLSWLTDPAKNGGGAIIDFGCYGANLMTWLQNGMRPIAVTAVTRQLKPDVYPKVDDDATIIIEYPHATGVIQASWDWSYSIKSLQVFGVKSSYHAINGNTLTQSNASDKEKSISIEEHYTNHLSYLSDVLEGKIDPKNDLSSLENNVIVVEILEAAKTSAQTGKKVVLPQ